MNLLFPHKTHNTEGSLIIQQDAVVQVLDPGFMVPFATNITVPFAVRRVDVAFCASDNFGSITPVILEVDGITDGNDIYSTLNEYSKVFTIYFDPPRQIQGNHTIRLKESYIQAIDLGHITNLCINFAFHNDF